MSAMACLQAVGTALARFVVSLPVVLVLILVAADWYSFTVDYCIQRWDEHSYPAVVLLLTVLFNLLLGLTLWCYYKTVRTSSSVRDNPPPADYYTRYRQAHPDQPIRVCARCQGQPKPLRAHHCSICGECILKMDHHCVAEGTLVTLADGSARPIETVQPGTLVLGRHAAAAGSDKSDGLVAVVVTARLDRGVRPCVELLFDDSRALTCTADHRIMTDGGGWVEAQDLVVGLSDVAAQRHCSVADKGQVAGVLPLSRTRLIGRRAVGHRRVYDLSVPSAQGERCDSFVANGVLVHNCPWVANCVGFKNYKFFVLFLLYATLACLLYQVAGVSLVIALFTDHLLDASLLSLLCALITAAFAFALAFFSLFHVSLVLSGQTTIEVKAQRTGHHLVGQHSALTPRGEGEDGGESGTRSAGLAGPGGAGGGGGEGDWKDNWRAVFGSTWRSWLLPIDTVAMTGYEFDFDDDDDTEDMAERGLIASRRNSAPHSAVNGSSSRRAGIDGDDGDADSRGSASNEHSRSDSMTDVLTGLSSLQPHDLHAAAVKAMDNDE